MTKKITARDISAIGQCLAGRSVVLVGLMGAGKTTVGRRLAQRLKLGFVDADHEIERAAGMSVSDIFAQHGEAHFRDGERRVIERLLNNGPQVLATGGGAFMDADTRERIAQRGVSVWLDCDHGLLMKRVRRRGGRPLLKADDPDAVMRDLMKERNPVYALADLKVMSREVAHSVIVNEIVRGLAGYLSIKGWDE